MLNAINNIYQSLKAQYKEFKLVLKENLFNNPVHYAYTYTENSGIVVSGEGIFPNYKEYIKYECDFYDRLEGKGYIQVITEDEYEMRTSLFV